MRQAARANGVPRRAGAGTSPDVPFASCATSLPGASDEMTPVDASGREAWGQLAADVRAEEATRQAAIASLAASVEAAVRSLSARIDDVKAIVSSAPVGPSGRFDESLEKGLSNKAECSREVQRIRLVVDAHVQEMTWRYKQLLDAQEATAEAFTRELHAMQEQIAIMSGQRRNIIDDGSSPDVGDTISATPLYDHRGEPSFFVEASPDVLGSSRDGSLGQATKDSAAYRSFLIRSETVDSPGGAMGIAVVANEAPPVDFKACPAVGQQLRELQLRLLDEARQAGREAVHQKAGEGRCSPQTTQLDGHRAWPVLPTPPCTPQKTCTRSISPPRFAACGSAWTARTLLPCTVSPVPPPLQSMNSKPKFAASGGLAFCG